jgi:hypothetical protein
VWISTAFVKISVGAVRSTSEAQNQHCRKQSSKHGFWIITGKTQKRVNLTLYAKHERCLFEQQISGFFAIIYPQQQTVT